MSDPTADLTPQEPGVAAGVEVGKLEALADGNVGDLVEGLDGLTSIELEQLLAIEQSGKNRTTALGAIQRELDSRASGADNEPTPPQAERSKLGDDASYARMRGSEVDPSKLERPVLTLDGWVLPHPQAKPEH